MPMQESIREKYRVDVVSFFKEKQQLKKNQIEKLIDKMVSMYEKTNDYYYGLNILESILEIIK
jgi:hypothetical protein